MITAPRLDKKGIKGGKEAREGRERKKEKKRKEKKGAAWCHSINVGLMG